MRMENCQRVGFGFHIQMGNDPLEFVALFVKKDLLHKLET
jgi:hypothetical protein